MINYSEIKDFEEFEELCDTLLKSEGLETRRLGRGPGQLGKDIVAIENLSGSLTSSESRKWLVECKFTSVKGAIDENDVSNIRDRVEAQEAHGYLLFTNARLRVNLERTLNGLKKSKTIGIVLWTSDIIAGKILLHSEVFRKYFPDSFGKWLRGNRMIYLNQANKFKSPLVHIHSYLQFLLNAPEKKIKPEVSEQILKTLTSSVKTIIDDLDESLRIIYDQSI
jgi:hypothetical protein